MVRLLLMWWACEREKDIFAAKIDDRWKARVYGIYSLPREGERLKDYARHLKRIVTQSKAEPT